MMNIDGTVPPILSCSIALSMDKGLMDVQDNLKSMKHPSLVFIGDKDKIVDNEGAIAFHRGTATPDEKKDLKMFHNCYHAIWKEEQHKLAAYQKTYEWITKMIKLKAPDFTPPRDFAVGRLPGARDRPYKRSFGLFLVVLYLFIGFWIWVCSKVFYKNKYLLR